MSALPRVSILIPVYNEKESIIPLYDRLIPVLEAMDEGFEVFFVDDGSTDGSDLVLSELHERDRRVQMIQFRRNFGKAAALAAGFSMIRGDVVVTMDGDLQDLPEEIPRLLEKLEEGYDLVSGWKFPRRDPWRKKLPSRLFNAITSMASGVRLHDMNCGFKAYRRELTDRLNLYGELHRYIPVVASASGFRVGEVKVRHEPRRFGKSKYGLWRFFSGFFDLFTVLILTRFGARPLHVFGLIGFLVSLLGGGITAYLVVLRLMGNYLSNRPLFYLGLSLLIVGIQVFFFGLLAEMIAHSKSAETHYSVRRCRVHPLDADEDDPS